MQENNVPLYSLTVAQFKAMISAVVQETVKGIKDVKSDKKEEDLLKIPQAAILYKVSRVTIYQWIADQKIRKYKIGGLSWVKRSEIENLLK